MSNGEWTGRRRLLTALRCGVPDRVPINTYELVGYNSRAWENAEPSYRRLMDRIRADTDCVAMWSPADDARFLCSAGDLQIEEHLERAGTRKRITRFLHTPAGDLRSVVQQDDHLRTVWRVEHWCKSTRDVERALSVPYHPLSYDASDRTRIVREVGDHGIVMASLADPAYLAADLMSFQDFTVWAYSEPDHFARVTEILAERVIENLRRQLSAGVVDLYRICGPEYFTPPYLPPDAFKRLVVPHVKRMTELIHQQGAAVRLHCHGRIGRVLDLFFQTGCDATDPCEPPPDGDVELDEVKRRCAAAGVCVFGNMELKLLEGGTPEQVRAAVRRMMDQAKPGGGYVLMPTAAPINIPLSLRTEENYMAFIDAGLEFGRY